jgi:hypothetical protein
MQAGLGAGFIALLESVEARKTSGAGAHVGARSDNRGERFTRKNRANVRFVSNCGLAANAFDLP